MLDTALAARVSPETLRKIESGRVATPAFPTIAAIAAVLGLSLDAVWAEINRTDGADGADGAEGTCGVDETGGVNGAAATGPPRRVPEPLAS